MMTEGRETTEQVVRWVRKCRIVRHKDQHHEIMLHHHTDRWGGFGAAPGDGDFCYYDGNRIIDRSARVAVRVTFGEVNDRSSN